VDLVPVDDDGVAPDHERIVLEVPRLLLWDSSYLCRWECQMRQDSSANVSQVPRDKNSDQPSDFPYSCW
jgi:hypothetical protein